MKRSLLPLLAFALAIGTSAFTAKSNKAALSRIWYDLTAGGSAANPLDYNPNIDNEQICFANTTKVCGVLANPDVSNPGHPDLSDPGKSYEFKP